MAVVITAILGSGSTNRAEESTVLTAAMALSGTSYGPAQLIKQPGGVVCVA